jgi:hypothetical protein
LGFPNFPPVADWILGLLCAIVPLLIFAGGVALMAVLGAKTAQTLGDWATGTAKATAPGGFQVALAHCGGLRYVVLHHTGVPEEHFDLMFETAPGSSLATWRSAVWPVVTVTAERLADHRREFLEYEGPVSGDRGQVRRVAAGEFHVEATTDGQRQFVLDGTVRLTFTHREGAVWMIEGEAAAT